MSDDLIRRSDAIDEIRKECQALHSLGFIPLATVRGMVDAINHAPTIEPKRGEWKPFDLTWGRSIWYCTACEESTEVPCDIWEHKPIYKYCPNCGADMREREGE